MRFQALRPTLIAMAGIATIVMSLILLGAPEATASPVNDEPGDKWVAGWASSQMIPDSKNAIASEDLEDTTLRQIVRVTAAGTRIRIRLSNAFGTVPLRFDSIEVAKSAANDTARIVSDTRQIVTFAGQATVTVPAGADYISDPVDLRVQALDDLAITTWQKTLPAQQTSHPGSRATSYLVKGNRVSETDLMASKSFAHWFHLSGIEVEGPARGAIVTLGDSITDGYGVQPNTNSRWPDTLMKRLKDARIPLAVLNQGIGGNRLLLDGAGPNALSRLERDVLAQPGVKYLIVLEGVNDLGTATRDAPISADEHKALVSRIIASYRQIIDRAHAHGIKVYGGTILPYGGNEYYHPDVASEADRQAINAWIRTPGHFDAVIDFDALMYDPVFPDRLKAEYDSGDHLHPSIVGYRAMGDFIDLKLFK